ncbi:hypothetical protein L0337_40320 [candidate division KSB1 bacterium]|nr:hypothetical protein [candidate division KSB1 bacterium]
MSFFTPQTKIVELDAENRVTVRKLTYGERQSTISQCMKTNAITQDNALDVGLMKRLQLRAAILTWEGPGFEGRPVSPENVDGLPPEIADRIQAGVEELNQPLDESEKK